MKRKKMVKYQSYKVIKITIKGMIIYIENNWKIKSDNT